MHFSNVFLIVLTLSSIGHGRDFTSEQEALEVMYSPDPRKLGEAVDAARFLNFYAKDNDFYGLQIVSLLIADNVYFRGLSHQRAYLDFMKDKGRTPNSDSEWQELSRSAEVIFAECLGKVPGIKAELLEVAKSFHAYQDRSLFESLQVALRSNRSVEIVTQSGLKTETSNPDLDFVVKTFFPEPERTSKTRCFSSCPCGTLSKIMSLGIF